MTPLLDWAVGASAIVTAGAATQAARYLGSVKQKVDRNEERSEKNKTRSQRNRQYITGEDTYREGLIPRVERLDDRRGET
ncbi:hypothetical protein [Halorubellus litoreus]|uniref:Uncharacterized protein n=1 Tax=Halorubellus litoreus TaxID=755308 RepID=A0ABD5VII5_9EURY